jgi:hypothetical protein
MSEVIFTAPVQPAHLFELLGLIVVRAVLGVRTAKYPCPMTLPPRSRTR